MGRPLLGSLSKQQEPGTYFVIPFLLLVIFWLTVFASISRSAQTILLSPLSCLSSFFTLFSVSASSTVEQRPIESISGLLKTGSSVIWQRLPIHLVTTFHSLPHLQVYSDAADHIAGHAIIDALADCSSFLKNSQDFDAYNYILSLISLHANLDAEPDNVQQSGSSILTQADDDAFATRSAFSARHPPVSDVLGPGWVLDKYKNLPMLAHAYRNRLPSTKWFVFFDGDSYILWHQLADWLATLDSSKPLYMGSIVGQVFEQFAHGGSGIVISIGAAHKLFEANADLEHMYDMESLEDSYGDHILAMVLLDNGIKPAIGDNEYPYARHKFQGEPQWAVGVHPENMCSEIMSFHHVLPRDIEQIYSMEQEFLANGRKVRYLDVFQRFVKPQLEPVKEDWNNFAKDVVYSVDQFELSMSDPLQTIGSRTNEADEESAKPYASFESCKAACDSYESCLQFRYTRGYCGLSKSVSLGQGVRVSSATRQARKWAQTKFADVNSKSFSQRQRLDTWTSGWRVDRIWSILENAQC